MVKEVCDLALFQGLLASATQTGPTSKGKHAVTLLSGVCIGSKGHCGYISYSSSGVLIKEDKQKTITSSLSQKAKRRSACGLKKHCWTLEGVGVENQKERDIFHYVNEERRKLKHKCIFEVGIW